MNLSRRLRERAAGPTRQGRWLNWLGTQVGVVGQDKHDTWTRDGCLPYNTPPRAPLHWRALPARVAKHCLLWSRPPWPAQGRSAMRRIAAFPAVFLAWGTSLPGAPAYAEPLARVTAPQAASRSPWAPLVAEAAARFAMPEAWLTAILAAESGGDPAAVSPAGAMGLMQIMPATWRTMSRTYGLGDDPFEPRANILAGAAYLRALHDRFGSPGFLAAYNAGPARYEAYRRSLRPLPTETMRYVARLASRLDLPGDFNPLQLRTGNGPASLPDWRAAPLFSSSRPPSEKAAPTRPLAAEAPVGQPRASLFPREWRSLEP